MITEVLKFIGNYSPIILPVLAIWPLENPILAFILVIDALFLNPFLKILLHALGLESYRPKCSSYKKIIEFECLGMPSGHSEMHWIFLSYIFFVYLQSIRTKNTKPTATGFSEVVLSHHVKIIFILLIILTTITSWERYTNDNHDLSQLLGGALVGITIGVIYYAISSY